MVSYKLFMIDLLTFKSTAVFEIQNQIFQYQTFIFMVNLLHPLFPIRAAQFLRIPVCSLSAHLPENFQRK